MRSAWRSAAACPPRTPLRFANHTAALTVSRLGAMPSLPTLAEVAATMPGGVSGLEG
ncbi:MAG: hypothetical protein ACLTCV_11830 [Oscillospiraceae bacterium]